MTTSVTRSFLPGRRDVLFRRSEHNPILTAADWPYPANTVFNPGATRLRDGTTLLLVRVEDMRGSSHLCVARSRDGETGWEIDPEPTFMPHPDHDEEEWGVEDPRITYLPEEDRYAVLYTAYSHRGPGVALALTEDFRSFERHGLIFQPEDKDAALYPRRFGGRWLALHRPVTTLGANIYLSTSTDMDDWGQTECVLEARKGPWWDAVKVGLSPPPIETDEGWLVMFHGVKVTGAGVLYRNGLALFDRDDPRRLLLRSDPWVLGPLEPYERIGDVDHVVFPCGTTVADDGDTLRVYYGAADSAVGVARASLRELLGWLREHGVPHPRRRKEDLREGDPRR